MNVESTESFTTEDIVNRISSLEEAARRLEPDSRERRRIIEEAAGHIDRFIGSLSNAKAYEEGSCDRLKSLNVEERGRTFDELAGILQDEAYRFGLNSSSGACFAYIPGGGIWTSSIADLLAAATNRYAGVYAASPGAVTIENQIIRWLCSTFGYPAAAHGNLSPGGSIANLIAIQTARDSFGVDSTNVKRAVIYTTAHAHHCIQKAIHTVGMDEAEQRTVPMNSRYQMNTDALRQVMSEDRKKGLRPFLVVATAGTTDTGAIDPLDAIADLCKEHKAWFHVDAAYGGFFVLVDGLKPKFKGIERSDSVVVDPHKGMFLPFGIGVVLVKESSALLKSYAHVAPYMQDALGFDEISPADCGPELTKHFRGLRLWLPLHLHGLEVFRANLEEKFLLCRHFYKEIKRLGFETGPEPELSVALFRYPASKRDEFNRKLLDAIQADGRCSFSSTEIDGEFWIRCAVLHFRSHLPEIELALRMIKENVQKLL
jgi:aromatic-L-amino-acid decarboxylase